MSEGIDCTTLRENPELFRIALLNAIEEITAFTSDECCTTLFQEPEARVLLKQAQFLQPGVKKSLGEAINNMWNQEQIAQKVSFIHQLQSKYPPDFIAWRPTRGEVPILNFRGHYLTETIKRLLYRMKKIETESEELQKTLHSKASAIQKSLKTIPKGEESMRNLHNYCENLRNHCENTMREDN